MIPAEQRKGAANMVKQLQEEIIKMVKEIKSIKTLKIIYHFIRGIRSGR